MISPALLDVGGSRMGPDRVRAHNILPWSVYDQGTEDWIKSLMREQEGNGWSYVIVISIIVAAGIAVCSFPVRTDVNPIFKSNAERIQIGMSADAVHDILQLPPGDYSGKEILKSLEMPFREIGWKTWASAEGVLWVQFDPDTGQVIDRSFWTPSEVELHRID